MWLPGGRSVRVSLLKNSYPREGRTWLHCVVGSYWSFYGGNRFGITLLPMLIGVGVLFWNGRSLVGWILAIAGALFILAGVIANMHIYFRPTSLFNTLVMLIPFVGGLGFMARALRPYRGRNGE